MALWQTTVTNVGAPLTIIGKDLDVGATFNADVTPGQGKLKAGTLMSYTVATGQLAKDNGTATFGVLADEYDDTNAAGAILPAMVYRRGVFLRQEIEFANNLAITPDSAIEIALRDVGIYLEQSYETYVGLIPTPAGVVPLGDLPTVEEQSEVIAQEREQQPPPPNQQQQPA